MVAIANWDDVQFEVPQALESFEGVASTSRRDLLREGTAFTLKSFARSGCQLLYPVILQRIQPRLKTLALANERHSLIHSYNETLLDLNAKQREWTDFLKQVWLFDGFETIQAETLEERTAAHSSRERWLQEGLSNRVFNPTGFQSIVTAEFVSLHGENMRDMMVQDWLGTE